MVQLTDQGARRLLLAVIHQTQRDAGRGDLDALEWLRCAELGAVLVDHLELPAWPPAPIAPGSARMRSYKLGERASERASQRAPRADRVGRP